MDTPTPVVTVRGQAELRCPPDVATVWLTVHSQAKAADQVRRELAGASQQVQDVLAELSAAVESSATTGIHVSPVFAGHGRPTVTGYQGSISSTVVISDLEALGTVLPALLAVPHAELGGPSWSLRHDNPVHAQARRAAIEDGRRRAEDYASAFGASVTGLLEVSDLQDRGGFPGAMRAMSFGLAGQGAEPAFEVVPQEQSSTGQVTLRFTISTPELS
ncbi:MAG: SIMPL domain-containing protein [Propionibacteriaceae bacterium]